MYLCSNLRKQFGKTQLPFCFANCSSQGKKPHLHHTSPLSQVKTSTRSVDSTVTGEAWSQLSEAVLSLLDSHSPPTSMFGLTSLLVPILSECINGTLVCPIPKTVIIENLQPEVSRTRCFHRCVLKMFYHFCYHINFIKLLLC